MSQEQEGAQAEGQQEGAQDGRQGEQATDWEAKYQEMSRHARDWEKKAKDNLEELKKLQERDMTEVEKAAKRAEEAEAELAKYRRAEQMRGWAESVAKATGVPADVLMETQVDSEEALREKAERIAPHFARSAAPTVGSDGKSANPAPKESGNDWIRSTLPHR